MIEGKTSTGFTFSIDEKLLNNMELVDALAEVDENPVAVSKMMDLLFGNQKKQLYDHLRTEDGRVPVEAVINEIMEIFEASGKAGKN